MIRRSLQRLALKRQKGCPSSGARRKAVATYAALGFSALLCIGTPGARRHAGRIRQARRIPRAGRRLHLLPHCGLRGLTQHGRESGVAYAGGLAISTPYGYLVSPNITPDDETGIGTWTADDFWRAIHFGINKRGEPLYPAMPYVFFTKVDARGFRRDLRLSEVAEAGQARRRRQSSELAL